MVIQVEALVSGEWRAASGRFNTVDPYRQRIVAEVADCGDELVSQAVASAYAVRKEVAGTPARERAALLQKMAAAVHAQAADIADIMMRETGKPITDALTEVLRSAQTLELSAQEAVRITGEHVPMDFSEAGAGKTGIVLRVPVGVIAAITPFNAPVNLCAHKVGPALAAGNPVVLKPSPLASATIHRFVQALQSAGIPPGWLNVVYGDAAGASLVRDPRVAFISFTGSSSVGERIRAAAGLRRVALELGGNGNTIVCHDADWQQAARACALNAVRLAGQSCISVQNVWVDSSLSAQFVDAMQAALAEVRVGDPANPETQVGTLVSTSAAQRVESMVADALSRGATALCGAQRAGAAYSPTLLVEAPLSCDVIRQEIFGPVANVVSFDNLDTVLEHINSGPFGLQAGIYTESLRTAWRLVGELEMGGVIVNGTSTWRSDQAPYGGIKASGIGREGPKYAIRDMTEEKFVVFNL